MPTNLSRLTNPKRRRRSGISWMRVSGRVKMLSFVAVLALVGSTYLLYSHAAAIDTLSPGDLNVTTDGALDGGDPVASAPENTDSTLIDNFDGTSQTDAASVSCSKFTLSRIVKGPGGENYDLNNDRYGNGDECARNTDGKTDFSVYDGGTPINPSSGVRAYPNLIRGCSSSKCYSNNWPKQVSSLANWYATGNIATNNAGGSWNANLDLWFNRSSNIGPSRGTEILIDLNRSRTRPTHGRHIPNIFSINGATYDLYFWRQSVIINGTKYTWNFLHYWRNTETSSINNLQLNTFWDKATTLECPNSLPCLRPSWYWTGADTGFEIWNGGYGLRWSGVSIHN